MKESIFYFLFLISSHSGAVMPHYQVLSQATLPTESVLVDDLDLDDEAAPEVAAESEDDSDLATTHSIQLEAVPFANYTAHLNTPQISSLLCGMLRVVPRGPPIA